MSSLLQFGGKVNRRGVWLEFYQVKPRYFETSDGEKHEHYESCGEPIDQHSCEICGKAHPRLWIAPRKPAGMFGQWVVFRYNGEDHVPDLSCPIAVYRMPRDAQRLDDQKSSELWHRG